MGLNLTMAVIVREICMRYGLGGPAASLGVPALHFSGDEYSAIFGETGRGADKLGFKEFFRSCGIEEVSTLDFSDYEGASVIVDLNDDELPAALTSRFSLILDSGTLEHVYNFPNALRSITRMLKPGGAAILLPPIHNWTDHGFYQFGPTLFHDYYESARFDRLEAIGLCFEHRHNASPVCDIVPLPPGALGAGLGGTLGVPAIIGIFCVRKRADSLENVRPTQSFYSGVSPSPSTRWFPPYKMINGRVEPGPSPIEFVLTRSEQSAGHAWSVNLPAEAPLGDSVEAPISSFVALFEDDRLLGPPHTAIETVQTRGLGAYTHWRHSLVFSTSDNSDPNTNGRKYKALIPQFEPLGSPSI